MITIKGTLPTLNEMISADRRNRYLGAKLKKQATNLCASYFMGVKVKTPFKMICDWYCKDKRTDPDNRSYSKKFLLDGMQKAGAIENDNFKSVLGFEDNFYIDKENPRVEIRFIEKEN